MKLLKTLLFLLSCAILVFTVTLCAVDAKIVYNYLGDLTVSNDDGSRRRRLTHHTTMSDRYARWSPDGRKIAFTRYMDKTQSQTSGEIFIMNADGTDPQRLTYNNINDIFPAWSPDGRKIAFTSNRSGGWQVYVVDLDTLDVIPLTGGGQEAQSSSPDWSRDGTQIAFERFIWVGNGILPKTVYLMDADGQDQRPALPDPPRNGPPTSRYNPRWSADGHRLLYSEVQDGVEHLYIKRLGGGKQKLTAINDRLGDNFVIAGACWMEGDQAILFSLKLRERPNPNYDLYRYTLSTRSLRKLHREESSEMWPDWISGELSVSPSEKKTTLWGELKTRP